MNTPEHEGSAKHEGFGIQVRYDSFRNRVLIQLDEFNIALIWEDAVTLSELIKEAVRQLDAANRRMH